MPISEPIYELIPTQTIAIITLYLTSGNVSTFNIYAIDDISADSLGDESANIIFDELNIACRNIHTIATININIIKIYLEISKQENILQFCDFAEYFPVLLF